MKKKIFLILLLVVGLFTITGCGKNNDLTKDGKAKSSFIDLIFKEPANFTRKEEIDVMEGVKVLIYYIDNTDEDINIYMHYDKGKGYEYITDSTDQYTEKEINGTTWRIMHTNDFGIECDLYYVVYNNDLYQVEFNGIDKKADMASFMDEVSFK